MDTPPLARAGLCRSRDVEEEFALNLVSSAFKFTRRGGIAIAMPRSPGRGDAAAIGFPSRFYRLWERDCVAL
jgi:hypothetical protein